MDILGKAARKAQAIHQQEQSRAKLQAQAEDTQKRRTLSELLTELQAEVELTLRDLDARDLPDLLPLTSYRGEKLFNKGARRKFIGGWKIGDLISHDGETGDPIYYPVYLYADGFVGSFHDKTSRPVSTWKHSDVRMSTAELERYIEGIRGLRS